ncbi:hypothetical protein ABPG74_010420 [Tetrahymena malaccensis]
MISKFFAPVAGKTFNRLNKYAFSSVTINLEEYQTKMLDGFKMPTQSTATKEELLKLYKDMNVMRKIELACDKLYKQREIRGFCHLYDGQEAVISGIEAACNHEDALITAYRCHCHAYTRGDTPHQIIAELMGRKTGSTGGKGGSMHFYRKKTHFYGGHGIVGAQVPMGAGLAFALKYQKKPNVSVTMYGDGAANQGQIAEAANMAGLWNLPCLFVCENNLYGMGTSTARASHNTDFYTRGDKIPGIRMDGNNYFHVKEGFKFAKQYAIEHGPLFIELRTYRYHGHSMSDSGTTYRTQDEIKEFRQKKDCIQFIANTILQNNFATQEQLEAIQDETREIVDKAVEQALKDPLPDDHELHTDVYINNDKYYIRGIEYDQGYFPEGKPY